ncbi:MAG: cupin domain-containing protein [Candidatus Methanoplasma sp.]|jgi:mannose-6-phosphate isomerase-like protein (cupin superfamily)|nr:cupin domain-containing protein [Candidatus Methanoplasma sp.]
MGNNIKKRAEFIKHPSNEGVFMKHFFGKDETDGLINNLEVNVMPGFSIAEHTHEDSGEFFFVISGRGEFLDGTDWVPIGAGDAFKAPKGMKHAIRNNGAELLRIFSTFSPPIR